MAGTRPTIRDVARRARVHASSVSRALNPLTEHLLSEAVRKRIRRVAKELGYVADPAATGLRTRRTRTIGVLVPDLVNPNFPPIVRGIESVLVQAGYTAVLANTDNDSRRAKEALEGFGARRVEGLIMGTALRREPLLARCRALGLPVVLVNRGAEGSRGSSVLVDDAKGVASAVAHLVALGHQRIGHVAGPSRFSTGQGRRQGFVEAIKKLGLAAPEKCVGEACAYTIAEGARVARDLLDRAGFLTALVAANDLLALGCYDELARRGLVCPRDVSVIGFNDMPFADRFNPPLTTVRIQQRSMGEQAARLLLETLAGDTRVRSIRLEPELVVRGSTAVPRTAATSFAA